MYEIFILVGGQHVADFSVHHRARYLFRPPPPPHPLPLPHILHNINACCLFRLYNSTHVKLISLQSVTTNPLSPLLNSAMLLFSFGRARGQRFVRMSGEGHPRMTSTPLQKKRRRKKKASAIIDCRCYNCRVAAEKHLYLQRPSLSPSDSIMW